MHDGVDLLFAHKRRDGFSIDNIPLDEPILVVISNALQTCEVSGVRQRIENYDSVLRILPGPILHEISSDESGATGYK